MHTDKYGNVVHGATPLGVEKLNAAMDMFALFRGDPLALADEALKAAPNLVMAHILKAYAMAVATEPEADAGARIIVESIKGKPAGEREASHIKALELVLDGEWNSAALHLDQHTMRHPRDLLALQVGHLMDFFRGNARNLRDRIARALPAWTPGEPGHNILLGLYAFGLEETGDYAKAEDAGRAALESEPYDGWAHHAVAHVFEMQGRTEQGLAWMADREPYWSVEDNFFQVHNWWHKALFHLDLGQKDEVLAVYDQRVRGDRSEVVMDLIDASALLWRAQMSGIDVGDRWSDIATAWDNHAYSPLYPFNDWHAAMAYLGAGRNADVSRQVSKWRSDHTPNTETARWAHATAIPLIEGFAAFWTGDYRRAVEILHPVRFIANQFGGSHAQRDIIDWTLIEAAIRGGLRDVAQALTNERLAIKPHSGVNLGFSKRTQALASTPIAAE